MLDRSEDIRIEMSGNRVVARCCDEKIGRIMVPEIRFQWCGKTFVSMGGIGGVGTKETFRKQGVAGWMMAQAVTYSKATGYVCGGVSTGAANVARRLYSRAGYAYVFSIQRFARSPRSQAADVPADTHLRGYREGDEHAVLRLREAVYGGTFGPRQPDVSRWLGWRQKTLEACSDSVLLAVQGGEPVGYASYFHHWFSIACDIYVTECRDRPAVGRGLVRTLESRLSDVGCEHAVFYATEDEHFVRALLETEGYQHKRDRAFHVNLFRPDALLRALEPCLANRVRTSRIPDWTGTLVIETEQMRATAGIGKASDRSELVLATSQPTLTQILCGRLSGWEAYLRGELHVRSGKGEAPALLQALLPGIPCCHPMDDWW